MRKKLGSQYDFEQFCLATIKVRIAAKALSDITRNETSRGRDSDMLFSIGPTHAFKSGTPQNQGCVIDAHASENLIPKAYMLRMP